MSKQNEAAKVVVRDPSADELDLKGFQSASARDAAAMKSAKVDDGEPVLGAMDEPQPVVVAELEDQEKLVPVRANRNELNFRVGTKMFSVYAGKTTLVPRHVARHLQEKGVIT